MIILDINNDFFLHLKVFCYLNTIYCKLLLINYKNTTDENKIYKNTFNYLKFIFQFKIN